MCRWYYILALWLFTTLPTFAQTTTCDSAYHHPEVPAIYKGGTDDLMHDYGNMVASILRKHTPSHGEPPSSAVIDITLDATGQVVAVDFSDVSKNKALTSTMKEAITQQTMMMEGWGPARQNGHPVCSQYILVIGCIKWG